ncbi:MAG TPA: NAD(P)-binding domain-containing protein, partial [Burkholderiales bacterium]|nr:NAD(P)-binding domain-containing protein [Burkholderiales bacterium]
MKKNTKSGREGANTVGQVGLGIMGGAYSKHLRQAGFAVAGFDLDSSRRAALKKLGGTAERSIADVGAKVSVIITSLPSIAAVQSAFFGAGGILESAKPGTIVIETSTLPLEVKLELRDRSATRRITVLDCPISGTGAQAAVKDISVYASGPEGAVRKC